VNNVKPALIIVDMLKDTFDKHPEAFISKEAIKSVPSINRLSAMFREKGLPVIFSCDSLLVDDFIVRIYEKTPLYPLLRVMSSQELIEDMR
jgi:nicotinamidase-related amidase